MRALGIFSPSCLTESISYTTGVYPACASIVSPSHDPASLFGRRGYINAVTDKPGVLKTIVSARGCSHTEAISRAGIWHTDNCSALPVITMTSAASSANNLIHKIVAEFLYPFVFFHDEYLPRKHFPNLCLYYITSFVTKQSQRKGDFYLA